MTDQGIGFAKLIIPDFPQVLHGGVEAVTPILVLLILAFAALVAVWVQQKSRAGRRAVREMDALLASVDRAHPWNSRGTVLENARAGSRVVSRLWGEFDETLVSSGRELHGSVPADSHFTEQRFAPALFGNRVLAAVPTALTTLGLLGTFLGLTVGLRAVDLGSTTDQLRVGIQTLVNGAALGFTASLWGVAMSLAANLHQRYWEFKISEEVHRLQRRIDALLPVRSPEQSLMDIARDSHDSNEALQVLHEKVGSALQESVAHVGENTSRAVSRAIHDSLAPIMTDLSNRAMEQSAEVFRSVSEQLTASFREMGESLAAQLKDSSEAMRSTLEYMGEQLARHSDEHLARLDEMQNAATESSRLLQESSTKAIEDLQRASGQHLEDLRATTTQHFEELRSTTTHQMSELQTAATAQMTRVNAATERQVRMLDESLPKVVEGLEQAASVVGAATSGMESIGDNLSRVAIEVAGASTQLGGMLADAIGSMGELADRTSVAAESITRQQQIMTDLTRTTTDTAKVLQQVSAALNGGFQGMTAAQQEFLADLERQLTKHTELMAGWLSGYADQVAKQTAHRMGEWNTQTERFSSAMMNVASALSDAVDEFDAVRGSQYPRGAVGDGEAA